MAECKFSGGIEKANLILSTGILQKAWDSILDLQKTPQHPFSIKEFPKSTILAFDSQNQAQDFNDPTLDPLKQAQALGFLITKDNPSISLHRSPLSTFHRLLDNQHLKEQLILVGQSLGGSVAALFTLWLLKNRSSTSLPLCITFGSPFIGDAGLQKTITKIEQWKAQFWHVVGLPRLFVPSRPAALQVPSSCSQFKPFGTYFLISGSGCVCIDDPDSVLDLLDLTTPNLGGPDMDYGATLQQLKEMKRYRSNVEPAGLQGSSHRMGLALQLEAIGIGANHSKYAELLHAMERREQDVHIKRKSIPNLSKRLNEVKKQMACLEWYKKQCEARNMNYYDCYKSRRTERDIDVTKFKNILTRYWEEKVKEAENKSQLPDFPMTTRFLYGGTTYMRMVEPLDIADHYRKRSSRDYTAKRSNHYKILEKWHEEERKDQKKKDKAPSITDDSCFWAQFEEAALKLDELKQGEVAGSKSELDLRKELIEFEGYVMMLVNNYELFPEVFLEHSGFMRWWEDYEEKLEPCYNSPFVSFMKSKGYLNYQ